MNTDLHAHDPELATLVAAFLHDPLMAYALPSLTSRAASIGHMFAGAMRHARRRGGVVSLDGGAGASVWVRAPYLHPGLFDMLRARMWPIPLRVGVSPLVRLERYEAWSLGRIAELADPEDGYLWMLGVDPTHKGKGLGRRSIEATFEAIGPGRRCFLKTENPDNVGLYVHLGFELVDERTDEASGLTSWVFVRPT